MNQQKETLAKQAMERDKHDPRWDYYHVGTKVLRNGVEVGQVKTVFFNTEHFILYEISFNDKIKSHNGVPINEVALEGLSIDGIYLKGYLTPEDMLYKLLKINRVQRLRNRGYKTPPNTKYVGRPTIYGNPHKVGEGGVADAKFAMELYRADLEAMQKNNLPKFECLMQGLVGYENVSCWCSLDKPCHADVLIEFYNEWNKL
jgi:hypothetical protein